MIVALAILGPIIASILVYWLVNLGSDLRGRSDADRSRATSAWFTRLSRKEIEAGVTIAASDAGAALVAPSSPDSMSIRFSDGRIATVHIRLAGMGHTVKVQTGRPAAGQEDLARLRGWVLAQLRSADPSTSSGQG